MKSTYSSIPYINFDFIRPIHTNLYIMEQPPKQQIRNYKMAQGGAIAPVVWLQSTEKSLFAQQQPNGQHEEYLKKEHQAYLAQKLKRKQELLKNKIKQFGDSSSDSDHETNVQKYATNDSSNGNQAKKTFQYYSGKGSSKADSQNQVSLKKIQSVHVSSSKSFENVDMVDIFTYSKKGVDIWIQQNLKFKEKIIKFNDFQCPYYDINKIKIIFAETPEKAFKIKINWNDKQFVFASSKEKTYYQLPQPYYIFAKIITQKLQIMNKNKYYQQTIFQFPQSMIKKSLIYGKILKKSSLISRWSSIYACINADGLWYSKKYSDKQKLLVRRTQIKELWTRFEFEEGHLIVKLFQNSSKIQIGIPVTNYFETSSWLFHLYDLIFKKS